MVLVTQSGTFAVHHNRRGAVCVNVNAEPKRAVGMFSVYDRETADLLEQYYRDIGGEGG